MKKFQNVALCQNQHKATHITSNLSQFRCSTSNCQYRYSNNAPKDNQIQSLINFVNDKLNWDWSAYQKIVEFYNVSIKTLQTDRDQIIKMMEQQPKPNLNCIDKWIIRSLKTGYLDFEKTFYQNQIIDKKQKIEDILMSIHGEFENVFMGLRSMWMEDKYKNLSQIIRNNREIGEKKLLKQKTIFSGNTPQTINHLSQIKTANIKKNSYKMLSQLLQYSPQLQNIQIYISNFSILDEVELNTAQKLSHFQKLKHLSLNINVHSSFSINQMILNNAKVFFRQLQKLSNLSKLSISFCSASLFFNLVEYIPRLSKLTSIVLAISNENYLNGEIKPILFPFQHYKSLIEMDISRCELLCESIESLANFRTLQRLRLPQTGSCVNIYHKILPQLLDLEVLKICKEQSTINRQFIQTKLIFTTLMPNLKQLDLSNIQVQDYEMMNISNNCPNLQVLNIYKSNRIIGSTCAYLSKLKHLTHLELTYSSDHSFTVKIINNLKKLRVLNVKLWKKVARLPLGHQPIAMRDYRMNTQFNTRTIAKSKVMNKKCLRNQILRIENTQINSLNNQNEFLNKEMKVVIKPIERNGNYGGVLKYVHTTDLQ